VRGPYNRFVVRAVVALLLFLAALAPAAAAVSEARAAVDAFLARLGDVNVTDLVIDQALTLFHPDGRHPQSSGEQRVYVKLPRRQRVEQMVDGQREVRLTVGDRMWVRTPDGKTFEAPPPGTRGDPTHLLVPFRRTGADLLAEWKVLGVRDDVTHAARLGDRTVTVIGAKPGERAVPQVWLDRERGVVRFVTREKLPQGEGVVDLAFTEHRPLIGGFTLPYRQEAYVDGKLVVRIVVRSASVNTGLDDALFDPDALRRGP
jgi:outer membrane lipoprotein-sorting protein